MLARDGSSRKKSTISVHLADLRVFKVDLTPRLALPLFMTKFNLELIDSAPFFYRCRPRQVSIENRLYKIICRTQRERGHTVLVVLADTIVLRSQVIQ